MIAHHMKTTTLSLTFPLFVFLILLKAVEAFLPKVLGHVQISTAAVTVDTLEVSSFSANFGSTLIAHRINIMLLNLQNDDAFLPCLVLELLPRTERVEVGNFFRRLPE